MSRPAPQYGEYATPEEVAALRGLSPDPAPTPAPAAPPPRAAATGRWDRPITIALLAFGVLNLVQYAGPLLDFEYFLEQSTVGTEFERVDFLDAARVGGVVLFLVCLALLVASTVLAVRRLRRGRLAFWIPLVAGALTVLAWLATLTAIVLLTPGALPTGT